MQKKFFHAKAKLIDIRVWETLSVIVNSTQAWNFGITALDKITVTYKWKEITLDVDLSDSLVDFDEIWITKDVYKLYGIDNWDVLWIEYVVKNPLSVQAIRKKLLWKNLTEEEVVAVVRDMTDNKISDTLVTYYAASSFFNESSKKELYYTAKASAEYWNKISFDGMAVVKYCIWWVPWNETSMILAPVFASLGIQFPKTFSKAITSPAATGECVETLMDIEFTPEQMKDLVKKTGCCLAWWKNLWLAPANDRIIKVSYPISMEAHSKMVVSIIAKIYAGGITHCLIDIPVGPTAKIKDRKTAKKIKWYFEYIGRKLWMKVVVVLTNGKNPIWKWIWGALQAREVLRILQQHPEKSIDLENKAIMLWEKLLSLTGKFKKKNCKKIIIEQIKSGKARVKMQEVISAQNWKNPHINSEELELWKYKKELISEFSWKIKSVDLRYLTEITRALGAPLDKQVWVYFNRQVGDVVSKWDVVLTIYANDLSKLDQVEWLLKVKDLLNF